MHQATSRHAPFQSAAALQSETRVAEPALETFTPDERYAAVCAGAIEHLSDLRAFARSLAGNSHQADDLVQSAILRALSAAQTFTPGSNFKAWSFTILRNVYYNHWRSPASHQVMLDDCPADAATTAPTQDASLEFCDFRRAFAQLVPIQREALLLIGATGLGYAEAAAVCNCAAGTMKSRVSRARSNLRTMMDRGNLNLRRCDVTPVSAMDLALALETSIASRSLPRGGRRPQPRLVRASESASDAPEAGYRPAELEDPPILMRS
jgi:RNA polymerase sigma-70 factor (ECF subfamily)